MSSQGLVSHFPKSKGLQYTGTHEGLVEQAISPATRVYLAAQEIKFLRAIPASRRSLGDEQPSLEELPHLSLVKKKPEHLPQLASSVNQGHFSDPEVCLYMVSKRVLRGISAKGQEHRWTFAGDKGLLKNSCEAATTWEAQGKRRTMALLNKVRKRTEKAPNPVDTRQFLEHEVAMNTKHPSKKQQQKSLEDLRWGHLEEEGYAGGPRQPRGLDASRRHVAPLEENTFLQGKKIKPHSKHPVQIVCPTSVREEGPGEELNPAPSGQAKLEVLKTSKEREAQPQFLWENSFLKGQAKVLDQDLLAEARPQLLHRRKMQTLEVLAKSHDKEFCVVNTIQLSFQDSKLGTSGRNTARHKWQPWEEGWDLTIQGTPVALAVRAHTYIPQGSKDQCVPKTRLSLSVGKSSIIYS
ncbi:protein Tex24-like [Peromyscus eremicus]|uniref:protein Tex24-like n=1 Tax=Peromyscus eremicus TaxID=42410 RepID=UPI0027DE8D68|nr:protein Tex24-like [Peromyscus eremicus]